MTEAIDSVAERFALLRKKWDLFRWLTPLPEVARREREAFFRAHSEGRHYDPRLEYPAHDPRECAMDDEWLACVTLPPSPLGRLLDEERRFLQLQIAMVASRGDAEAFMRHSATGFGMPHAELVARARRDLAAVPPDPADAEYSAADLREMAEARLRLHGIQDWTVLVDYHLVSIMKIDSGRRRIELRGDFTFGEVDRISLLHHEIDGHVVRAENGFALGHEFLGLGVGFETELDEGIACCFERAAGGLVGRRYQELAARVVAVDAASRLGFHETYRLIESIAPGIGPDLTYQLVLRVKRGLCETAAPGCWSKDALYYQGLDRVRRALEGPPAAGPAFSMDDLMVARVSWDGLQPVREWRDSRRS